ncbi:MAG: DJ-1/PfpI family protein [Actinobacteria bacterium]|nr:MAG: DJ-1/PfpI family protein [Actinomycetota bacterium]
MTRIGIALFDGAEELDWAGPWEVLAAWAQQWPDDGVEVFTLSQRDGEITCAKGLRVLPDRTWAEAGKLDVLVYPGGRGTRRELKDEAVLEWLRGMQGDGALMTSVCTGALVYAAAGFLRTAAGVSAGIDMALHLVARLHSKERAREVRRYIQYDPEPPV